MRVRVERDVLAEAVSWTARGLPLRPAIPVLAGLLVQASSEDGGLITLSSFDYEVSARVAVHGDVLEPGTVLVSGRLLSDIARSLPARPVELTRDGPKVLLTCGGARFTLLTLPVEDYPALPEMPAASGSVPGDVFAAAVGQVAVAAGRDDTLPVLTGVRVEIEGERLTLAATDRYRLAVRTLRWVPEQAGLAAIALVPARTLADTAKSLAAADKVSVALSPGSAGEGLIGFEGNGRRTTSRLLEGEFPKYRSLLPSESSARATVETAALMESVRRVALVAERNTPLRLSFAESSVTLQAGSGEAAEAEEAIDATLDGEDITVAFNPTYLLDGLGALATPAVRLSFTTPARPVVLTGATAEGDEDGDYRYLVMPVRLSG